MRKLSKAERFVLTKLEENSRQPLSRVAKQGRLSPEGVTKIITRLEKNKIIRGYKTKSNYSKLGITIYRAYIKLKKKDSVTLTKIKKILSRNGCCPWHSFCEGEFDLRISIEIKSAQELDDMKNLFIDLESYTAEKQIMIFLNAFSLSKIFNEQKTRRLFTVINHKDKQVVLTESEKKLIQVLRFDPLIKITDAADKLNLSLKTISKILKKLLKSGVITGFESDINMANLDYLPFVALFVLGEYNELDLEKFQVYCKNQQGITYFIYGIGNYSIEIVMFMKTTNEFYGALNEIREKFPFIRKISTMIEGY